jgi:UDP-N-acetyl-D-glucosamine dehydrogenase
MPDLVVHGLGYTGLTAAVTFAKAGQTVLGYDPDLAVVSAVNAGQPRAGEFLGYLDVDVKRLVDEGRLRATWNLAEALVSSRCATHLIAVPTERNGKPDDRIIRDALAKLFAAHGPRVPSPLTVIIESTLQPGTLDRFLAEYPVARAAPETLRQAGVCIAVCPRRDWFADPKKNLATLARVVGGYEPCCTEAAFAILQRVTPPDLLLTTDYRTAELTKALENALFHLPIMYLHQLALALPKHNVAEAARLAATHWRFRSFGDLYLGFGPGGRCVPLGQEYLVAAARYESGSGHDLELGEMALEAEPQFHEAVARAVSAWRARRILVLGVAYRPDFRDAGRSPGLAVARELARLGGEVTVHDNLWPQEELGRLAGSGLQATSDKFLIGYFDAVLLATPHSVYLDWPERLAWSPGQIVLDAQGAWVKYRDFFRAADVTYRRVGEPGWRGGADGRAD